MPTWTQDNARCEVLTFKAGLLSAMGHDLLLRVNRFTLSLDDDQVEGTFDGTSISVTGAMKNGQLAPGTLSEKDKRDIVSNLKAVFKRHQADQIRFEAEDLEVSDDFIEGEGTLSIPPNSRDVDFEVTVEGDEATCEVTLHQPHWGIAPFKALMGALKIQPDVTVRIVVPWTS